MPPIYVLLTLSCYTRTFEMEEPNFVSVAAQRTIRPCRGAQVRSSSPWTYSTERAIRN